MPESITFVPIVHHEVVIWKIKQREGAADGLTRDRTTLLKLPRVQAQEIDRGVSMDCHDTDFAWSFR